MSANIIMINNGILLLLIWQHYVKLYSYKHNCCLLLNVSCCRHIVKILIIFPKDLYDLQVGVAGLAVLKRIHDIGVILGEGNV